MKSARCDWVRTILWTALCTSLMPFDSARGDICVPGADGLDGAFMFVPDTPGGTVMTIDLRQAATLPLNAPFPYAGPPPVPGKGV